MFISSNSVLKASKPLPGFGLDDITCAEASDYSLDEWSCQAVHHHQSSCVKRKQTTKRVLCFQSAELETQRCVQINKLPFID